MAKVPKIRMNNGLFMPGFGLGTFEVSNCAFNWVIFIEICLEGLDFSSVAYNEKKTKCSSYSFTVDSCWNTIQILK